MTVILRTPKHSAWLGCMLVCAASGSLPFAAHAGEPLSLRHGIYARAASPCKGAPNASLLSWDGMGFSGAHATRCSTHVVHKAGRHCQVSTTCLAQGDGTAIAPGADYSDQFSLNRLSNTRFELLRDHQAKAIYRWCAAKAVD
jgi:hypothetical protein